MILFLFAHVVDTAVVGWGPEAYNRVVSVYHNWVVKLLELGLVAAVLYHAINGVKIMVFDFWPGTTRHMKGIALASTVIFVLSMIPVTWIMGQGILEDAGVLMAVEAPERSGPAPESLARHPRSRTAGRRLRALVVAVHADQRTGAARARGRARPDHARVGRRGGPRGFRIRRCAVAEPVLANLGLGAAGTRAIHGINGLRIIVQDYVRWPGVRFAIDMAFLVIGFGLFVLGSVVVFTFDASQWPGAV